MDESNRKLLAAASYRNNVKQEKRGKRMKIKIERNQKEKIQKKKKERVVSMGKHRKMVLAL